MVYSGAFGNAAPRVPNIVNTRFRIASVCKLLLAVTTFLQEEGKLRLDDPIGKYLKSGGEAGRVTIRHLLSHTSGLPNPEEVETPPIQAYRTPLSLDAYIAKYLGASTFSPGSRFSYNNFDFIVLSKVIESAAGEAWSAAVKRRVLDPSGMTSSGLFTDERVPVNLALGQYRDASGA